MVSVLCYNFEGKSDPKIFLYRLRKKHGLKNYKGATVFEDDKQAQTVFQKLKDDFEVDVAIVTEERNHSNEYVTTITTLKQGVLLFDELLSNAVEYPERFADEVANLNDDKQDLIRKVIKMVEENG